MVSDDDGLIVRMLILWLLVLKFLIKVFVRVDLLMFGGFVSFNICLIGFVIVWFKNLVVVGLEVFVLIWVKMCDNICLLFDCKVLRLGNGLFMMFFLDKLVLVLISLWLFGMVFECGLGGG